MAHKLRRALFALLLIPSLAFAQNAEISGTITDDDGAPLPGAQVLIPQFTIGATAGLDGTYSFEVPAARVQGQEVLVVARFVGFRNAERTITLSPGTQVLDFAMRTDLLGLDEVVVTGVASGTPQRKLGFSVGRVDAEDLQEVPATDPVSALRGKVAGVTIVQGSGDPSSSADIRLRGTTSIAGSSSPLIIVDGIITAGSIRDINMEDVESIEVVKGAAAASLYGSLAGNGVIQIRTRRGADRRGEPEVRFRSEVGVSSIADSYPAASRHPFVLDTLRLLVNGAEQTLINPTDAELDALPSDTRVLAWNGRQQSIIDPDGLFDNRFPVTNDNVDAIFTGQAFSTNYVSVGTRTDQFSFLTSFERFNQGGVIAPVDDYNRNTFRLNADYTPSNKFEVQFSGSYIGVDAPNITEQGQGDNFFYSALVAEPFISLTERDADSGDFSNNPTGYTVQGSNFQNPLYVAEQRETQFERTRLIGGLTATYRLTDWLSFSARQSLDRSFVESSTFFPVGYVTPTPSSTNDGSDARFRSEQVTAISEAWAQTNKTFGKFNSSITAKYLYEDRSFESLNASGQEPSAVGVRNLGATNSETFVIGSFFQEERAENFFVNADLDYDDKYIVSGLVRRDGSSSFGADERWQTYYRLSGAYRVTEDFALPNVDELKLRASYGTSGQRPPFAAQYETYSVGASGIFPGVLGNRNLKPSEVQELEVGFNLGLLSRIALEVNYAMTQTKDDYLNVPLAAAAGFTSQFQNVGEIESSAFEVGLSNYLIQRKDLSLDFNLTFSQVQQRVTDLGGRPAFTIQGAGALPLFRVEEGVDFGAIYGSQLLTSLDDLTLMDGEVLNAAAAGFDADVNGDGAVTREDFEINGQGYVVPLGSRGTRNEQPVYLTDENGERAIVQIGNTQPDFQMGFTSNFKVGGFGFFALLDWVQGADVYNYTKQLLMFNDRHQEQVDLAAEGYDYRYTNGSSNIYNAANASSYFVEDASFLKLREFAVSYSLSSGFMNNVLGNRIKGAKLSLIGRNLLTFTDYSGWDPEVALQNNSTNFRLDEFAYPNFRTYTAAIDLRF